MTVYIWTFRFPKSEFIIFWQRLNPLQRPTPFLTHNKLVFKVQSFTQLSLDELYFIFDLSGAKIRRLTYLRAQDGIYFGKIECSIMVE